MPSIKRLAEDRAEIQAAMKKMSTGMLTKLFLAAVAKATPPGSGGFTSMAHPVWLYGTVIRPTRNNRDFDHSMRQMVVGPAPGNDYAIVAIVLNDDEMNVPPYAHLREGIHERWEEVPD